MFKKNHHHGSAVSYHHLQIPLTSHVDELPEKLRKRLDTSWAGVFYPEFFCRLPALAQVQVNEAPFGVLYADCPSRPNVPVNVMVGLEYLKAGNGWTDEEMYDAFCYDVQVRYALGYRQLGDGDFDLPTHMQAGLRTLYYFRERLPALAQVQVSRHMQETGVNLLDEAFEQVTDAQIAAFQLKTGKQRTPALAAGASVDSTQVASNIRRIGRVQLLVEVLQRVHRMLKESDQQGYAEAFAPYLKGHAGQYVYRMKGEETGTHLQRIGEFMQRLLADLKVDYASKPVYQVLERVFGEHFQVEHAGVVTRPNETLSAASLPAAAQACNRRMTLRQAQGRSGSHLPRET
jgi:hypothetical protein